MKELSKSGDIDAQNALEKLYWDGDKAHAVGTVVIRDGVTSIGERVFEYCSSLTEIKLPDSVTYIGNNAFFNCSSLKKITYSKKIESRLKKVFDSEWYKLEKIVRD